MFKKIKKLTLSGIVIGVFVSDAYADHPGEGSLTVESLASTAISNSLEIKSLEQKIQSLNEQKNASYGAYSPRLSLESGPQFSRVGGVEKSDTAIYGKLDWNLYRGGADQLDTKIFQEHISGLEKLRSSMENRIRSEIAEVYAEMQFVSESIALKNEALTLNAEQKKAAMSKNSAGLTAKSDVLEFELRESTILSDIVMLEQNIAQLSRKLNTITGKSDDKASIRVKGHLVRIKPVLDRSQLVQSLITSNETMIEGESDQRVIELEKRKIKSAYFPKLDLETRYGRLGNAESVNPDRNDLTVLLKVSVPIFSGLDTVSRSSAVDATSKSKKYDLERERLHLYEEVDGLITSIESIQRRLDIEEKNLAKSSEYYDATIKEYRRGLKNSPDMVGATERVLETRIRNLEFRRDLAVAVAKLSKLTGVRL